MMQRALMAALMAACMTAGCGGAGGAGEEPLAPQPPQWSQAASLGVVPGRTLGAPELLAARGLLHAAIGGMSWRPDGSSTTDRWATMTRGSDGSWRAGPELPEPFSSSVLAWNVDADGTTRVLSLAEGEPLRIVELQASGAGWSEPIAVAMPEGVEKLLSTNRTHGNRPLAVARYREAGGGDMLAIVMFDRQARRWQVHPLDRGALEDDALFTTTAMEDSLGHAVALWYRADALVARRYDATNGTWTAPAPFPGARDRLPRPLLAASPSGGSFLMAYTRCAPGHGCSLLVSQSTASSAWSVPVVMPGLLPHLRGIGLGRHGHAAVFYSSFETASSGDAQAQGGSTPIAPTTHIAFRSAQGGWTVERVPAYEYGATQVIVHDTGALTVQDGSAISRYSPGGVWASTPAPVASADRSNRDHGFHIEDDGAVTAVWAETAREGSGMSRDDPPAYLFSATLAP